MIDDDEEKRERRRKKIAEADYDVGFGKTPETTRFKPGKSGNAKGRPPKAKGIKTMVQRAAEAKEEYSRKGKKGKAARMQIALESLSLKAAGGDLKATELLIKLYAQYGPLPPPDGDDIDAAADQAALEELKAHILKYGTKRDGSPDIGI